VIARACLAAGCALAGALLLASPAAAAPGVAVQAPGHAAPLTLSDAQVRALADVGRTRYRLRDEPGGATRAVTRAGTSLAAVLRAVGIDPAAVPALELTRDDGSVGYLSRDEIDPARGAPPIVWAAGGRVGFLRAASDAQDANGRDAFSPSAGTPLRLTVRLTAVLRVRIRAQPAKPAPRDPVTFTAEVSGAQPGESVAYEWRFGDGTTAAGQVAEHAFRRRGTYTVTLRVAGSTGAGGSAPPLALEVGDPPARSEPPRTTARPAPDTATPAAGTQAGDAGAGTSTRAGTPPRADEAAAARRRAAARERAAARRRAAQRRRQERERRRERAAREEPAGTPVRGTLLGAEPREAVAATTAQARPAATIRPVAARTPQAAEGVPAGVLVGGAVAGLVALGAWREARRRFA